MRIGGLHHIDVTHRRNHGSIYNKNMFLLLEINERTEKYCCKRKRNYPLTNKPFTTSVKCFSHWDFLCPVKYKMHLTQHLKLRINLF